jgi:hypothetical protein
LAKMGNMQGKLKTLNQQLVSGILKRR